MSRYFITNYSNLITVAVAASETASRIPVLKTSTVTQVLTYRLSKKKGSFVF